MRRQHALGPSRRRLLNCLSSQKARLNGTVIRCFLPTHIPLNIQKDGIAVHIKNIAPLVEAIVSLVH